MCSGCVDDEKHLLFLSHPCFPHPLSKRCAALRNQIKLFCALVQTRVLFCCSEEPGCPTPWAVGQSSSLEWAIFSTFGTQVVGPVHLHFYNTWDLAASVKRADVGGGLERNWLPGSWEVKLVRVFVFHLRSGTVTFRSGESPSSLAAMYSNSRAEAFNSVSLSKKMNKNWVTQPGPCKWFPSQLCLSSCCAVQITSFVVKQN